MSNQTVKVGKGYLQGVSNNSDQPGKMLTLSDGDIILCHLTLDTAFPDRIAIEDGMEVTEPGVYLNLQFVTDLRVETDGQALNIYWY